MAMQQKPKPVAKKAPVNSTPPSKPTPKAAFEGMRDVTDSLDNVRSQEMKSNFDANNRAMKEENRRIMESANSIGVSRSNQSSPGKTSGGFSYRLKKD
jgi:hypothetical protein